MIVDDVVHVYLKGVEVDYDLIGEHTSEITLEGTAIIEYNLQGKTKT